MLAKPVAGWTMFECGDFSCSASYLDDVPQMFIDAFTFGLNNCGVCAVELDQEGCYTELLFNRYHAYAIQDRTIREDMPNIIVTRFDKSLEEFVREFIYDINSNYSDWQNWMCYQDELQEYDLTELKKALADYR